MSEINDYNTLKRHIISGHDRIDRIENMVLAGMPDTNLCICSRESWIEFKSPKEPKKLESKLFADNHKLSVDQRNWIKRQHNAGGNAYVLLSTDKRWMLIGGDDCDLINGYTLKECIQASMWYAEKPIFEIDWMRLKYILGGNIEV